jgi:ribose transport system substrate-binding protein
MKHILSKSCLGFAVAAVVLGSLPAAFGEDKAEKKAEYKFVIVPKVVHPWFDQVNETKAAK